MAKDESVAAYVGEVAKLVKTGITTELSYRGPLTALLDAIAPGLKAVNEPKREACGAPDFIVQDKNGAAVFYVETKQPGDNDLDGKKRTGHKEQFDRYKAALDTIIFTDYLDFHLYRYGEFAGAVRIGDLDDGKVKPIAGAFDALAQMVGEAAAATPQKIESAKKLAKLMAAKARIIQRVAESYLSPLAQEWEKEHSRSATVTTSPAAPLLSMMLDFRAMLLPEVGASEFSDIFAQTLTYGMFAARLNDPTPETFSRMEAMALIPKSNPFLKQVFTYIATNLEDELDWAVDDLAELFAHADVSKIMKGYGKTAGMADPMVHFYEDFLREYDADLRKDRGVWYTPIQVVKFIVSAVDWALREKFSIADGLADSSTTQIEVEEATAHGKKLAKKVKKTVHRVQVLDPATGTGTFIAQTVRKVREKFDGQEGLWPGYVERDLLPRLNGFELMMASYTMAHVKLDYVLRETGVAPSGKERFRVFLTDSLSDWHKELPGGLFAAALGAEQQGADEVKRDIPVMVVMGNPPYSGEGQNKGEWIMRLMEDYKKEPGGKIRLNERNPKWINDDYVKFIRLAEHYVEKNGSGIVAYITPHGFLDNPTFRGMRWRLMQTFDEIWTLDLHGNTKKREVAPDGGKDVCVFAIQQGVAITLMVKMLGGSGGCKVWHSDLWGKKAQKLAALDSLTMDTVDWQKVKPSDPMFFFVPKDTNGEAEWNAGFGVAELMKENSTGSLTANDTLNVSFTAQEQSSKIADLLSKPENEWRHLNGKAKDSRDWIYASAKQDALSSSPIRNYCYRPFDVRYTLYTGKSKGLYTNPRHNVMRHFLHGENVAMVICRQSSSSDWHLIYIADGIVDDSYVSNRTKERGYVFPLWLYEENMGSVEKRANMDKAVLAKIASAIGAATVDPEQVFAYIYGVLHTPSYRAKFKEFLKTEFPRIPYPKDKAQFEAVAAIGKELIDIHLMRDAAPGLSETRARFPVAGNNEVDEVRFEETPGGSAGRVWINATQHFASVPMSAWGMTIGGYFPAQKWLKDRKCRTLSVEDIKHYQRIIIALIKTAEAVERLESVNKE